MVYDLGHGTFDVAVVSATTDQNEPFKQITQDGDSQIGGRILDELLYQEACRQLEDQLDFVPENANDVERIHQLVVEIKHELSREMDSERDFVSSEGDAVVHVTRKQFEEMIRETLQPTFEKVDELLRRADEKNVKVSEIVLTGGSSEIPYIKNCLETMTGKEIPVIKHRPTDAVVFGAARFAFNMPDINEENVKVEVGGQNGILTQITEYAYGVVLPKQPLMEEVEYMIQPGQTLPATTKAFVVCGDDRIKIRVRRSRHRGVSNPPTDRQNCEYYCDLPFEVGKNERCEFTMTLDENRFIQVTCRRTDGKTISKNSQNAWK